MSYQSHKNNHRAGVTLSQACMFFTVITSLAAFSIWVVFQIQNMNKTAKLDQISEKVDKLGNRNKKLENYKRRLNTLIALEEASLTPEAVKKLKSQTIEQHEGLSDYKGSIDQLVQLLELEIRRLARKQRQLRLMKKDLNSKLSIQKSRLAKFKGIYSNKRNNLTSFKSDLDTKREQLEQQISSVQDETKQSLNQLNNQLEQLKSAHKEKIQELDIELSGIKTSISELKERQDAQFITIDETDGKIIRTETKGRWAYINIGKKDRVEPGMLFGVFANSDDNERTRIGMIHVKEVFSDYARCKITSEKDPSQPVLENHEISNPFFSTKGPKRIAILGSFPNENKLKEAIRSAGSTVQEELSPELNYVIAGRNYQESDRFSKARDLGILFSKFDHFRTFVTN